VEVSCLFDCCVDEYIKMNTAAAAVVAAAVVIELQELRAGIQISVSC
jgi:hypothetical protein